MVSYINFNRYSHLTAFSMSRIFLIGLIALYTLTGCKKEIVDECPACPRIDSMKPNKGRSGDLITLRGINFGDFLEGRDKITIGGKSCIIAATPTNTVLQFFVPNEVVSGDVVVTIDGDLKSTAWGEAPQFSYIFVKGQ